MSRTSSSGEAFLEDESSTARLEIKESAPGQVLDYVYTYMNVRVGAMPPSRVSFEVDSED